MSEMTETPWRLYALNEQGEPECLAACDEFAIGEALLDQRRKGRACRGIMFRPFDDEPGEWIINPWESGLTETRQPAVGSGRLRSATRESTEEASDGTDE